MNNKATVQDVGITMVFFFAAVILFFVVHYSYGQFVDKVVNNTIVNSSINSVNAFNQSKTLSNRLDYVAFGLLMGLILAVIITGWLVSGHPIFMFIYSLVLFILIAVSAVFSYAWNKISTTAIFAVTLTKFPISDYILNNFPIFITIIGFLGIIVMFAKPYFQGGSGGYE